MAEVRSPDSASAARSHEARDASQTVIYSAVDHQPATAKKFSKPVIPSSSTAKGTVYLQTTGTYRTVSSSTARRSRTSATKSSRP